MARIILVFLFSLGGCDATQDDTTPYIPPAYDSDLADDTDLAGDPPTPQRVCDPLDTALQVAQAWDETKDDAPLPLDSPRLGFTLLDPVLDGSW